MLVGESTLTDAWRDYEYAKERKLDRLYISAQFLHPSRGDYWRFAHRVFPERMMSEVIKEKDEAILRTTTKGFQQVKVKFCEDDRRVSHLWLQKWHTKNDNPVGEQFILYKDEISALTEFLLSIARVHIPHEKTFNVNFDDLRLVYMPDNEVKSVIERNPRLVAEFARSGITNEDIIALGYRRKALETFRTMLEAEDISEAQWQLFFEQNKWIFGYGLAYIFTTSLDGDSLQGTIRGSSIFHTGKRPDGILKTRAAISSLCLVEIKKSVTPLLKREAYRSGTWSPSAELSGAVAQSQENVRVAIDEMNHHYRFTDENGDPTGEEIMAVQPRSFLIIGKLTEFQSKNGVNVARYRSFEDYRRNLRQPEILTFDELYERARFIVETEIEGAQNADHSEDEERIPF
jgi:hypothetical protein